MLSYRKFALAAMAALLCPALNAQTERGETGETVSATMRPVDGICEKNTFRDRLVLPYDHIREADVFYEKRIWREVILSEKMNQFFSYPKLPFFGIIRDAVQCGKLTPYKDEDFTQTMSRTEVRDLWGTVDTVEILNPETFEITPTVVTNDINVEDIKSFRIKEVWFFDEESSSMKVRILGIAPVIAKYADDGNFLFNYPMFWFYYPEARGVMASKQAFLGPNDAQPLSWEDIFEMRYFASYITKGSDVSDRRLQDIYGVGVSALLASDKISNEIFNFEQDLWER